MQLPPPDLAGLVLQTLDHLGSLSCALRRFSTPAFRWVSLKLAEKCRHSLHGAKKRGIVTCPTHRIKLSMRLVLFPVRAQCRPSMVPTATPRDFTAAVTQLLGSKPVLMCGVVLAWCRTLFFSLLHFMGILSARSLHFSRSQCVKQSYIKNRVIFHQESWNHLFFPYKHVSAWLAASKRTMLLRKKTETVSVFLVCDERKLKQILHIAFFIIK